MTRQEANRKIIEKIALVVEREPDWRFHQILQNLGIEERGRDQWYDESEETLANSACVPPGAKQNGPAA